MFSAGELSVLFSMTVTWSNSAKAREKDVHPILLAYSADFGLVSLHYHMSKYLKINLYLSFIYIDILLFLFSWRTLIITPCRHESFLKQKFLPHHSPWTTDWKVFWPGLYQKQFRDIWKTGCEKNNIMDI